MSRAQAVAPEASATSAEAADASLRCESEQFVVLTVAPPFDVDLAHEVVADLVAELAPRGIGVCGQSAEEKSPAAVITLRGDEAVVAIELDDHMTHKRVARDLRLNRVPRSGHALAIAIAVDELLRASWAELSLSRDHHDSLIAEAEAKKPVLGPKPEVVRARRRFALEATAGAAHGPEHWNAFSLGAQLSVWPVDHGMVTLGVNAWGALPATSSLGEANARGITGTLLAAACTEHDARLYACAGPKLELSSLRLSGDHANGARAHAETALAATVLGTTLVGLRLSERMFATAQVGFGAPIKSVHATDGTRTLLGMSGFLITGQLTLGARL